MSDPFDEYDEFPDDSADDKELNIFIDDQLAKQRPERYDSGEKDWQEPVVSKVADALRARPELDEVIEDAARRRVRMREGAATKQANKVLRDIADTGQLPLGWGEANWRTLLFDILHLPLSIDRQRIRFGAASPHDLDRWELEYRRKMAKDQDAGNRACDGARQLARWLTEDGADRVEEYLGSRLQLTGHPHNLDEPDSN